MVFGLGHLISPKFFSFKVATQMSISWYDSKSSQKEEFLSVFLMNTEYLQIHFSSG